METSVGRRSKKGGIQVQSVSRAMEILRCFQTLPELGISEIAAEMDLNKSTTFGLVNTLMSYGFLEQMPETRKYRLGLSLLEFGNLVLSRIDIRREAREACFPLAAKYHATVHIATHIDGEVIYIDKIDKGDSLISISNVGKKVPMHCCGVGKAMLAFLPQEYLKQYVFNKPLQKLTPNTITEKSVLLEQLQEIKETRIAFDREEIEVGLCCIASPILQQDGLPQIAISLSFPYGRINEIDQNAAREEVLACAKKLSERLGYRE